MIKLPSGRISFQTLALPIQYKQIRLFYRFDPPINKHSLSINPLSILIFVYLIPIESNPFVSYLSRSYLFLSIPISETIISSISIYCGPVYCILMQPIRYDWFNKLSIPIPINHQNPPGIYLSGKGSWLYLVYSHKQGIPSTPSSLVAAIRGHQLL